METLMEMRFHLSDPFDWLADLAFAIPQKTFRTRPMSAFGTKRTFQSSHPMSAFGGKADMTRTCDVRF
jgi:hypothetical protein